MNENIYDQDHQEYVNSRLARLECAFQPVIERQISMGISEPEYRWECELKSTQHAAAFIAALASSDVPFFGEPPNRSLRAAMADSLASESAYPHIRDIVLLYESEPDEPDIAGGFGSKGALANTIVEHAKRHRDQHFDTVLTLASNANNGISRFVFLSRFLKQSKDPRAHALIRDIATNHSGGILGRSLVSDQWRRYWLKHAPELWQKWQAEDKLLKQHKKATRPSRLR